MDVAHRQVLFICTGNYYRSRYAELYFDHLAARMALPWRAASRGVSVLTLGHYNVGPLALETRMTLEAQGIYVGENPRAPLQLTAEDFERADRIVAICEEEHQPLLEATFPDQAPRIVYWDVQDRAFTPPTEALAALALHVQALVRHLRQDSPPDDNTPRA